MTINLSGEVESKMLDTLVNAITNAKTKLVKVYISSPGGETGTAEAIIDLINLHKDKIEVIFYGEVFSAGMIILLALKCPKRILKNTIGMYHFAWQSLDIAEGGKPTDAYSVFSIKELRKAKAQVLAYLKTTPLTDKEIRLIKNGKDAYFSYDRMLEIINKQNAENNI